MGIAVTVLTVNCDLQQVGLPDAGVSNDDDFKWAVATARVVRVRATLAARPVHAAAAAAAAADAAADCGGCGDLGTTATKTLAGCTGAVAAAIATDFATVLLSPSSHEIIRSAQLAR